MGRIKILDAVIANKIAAGEVIERPISVVKELVENSLDAEATFIEIMVKDGGLSLIKVTDNGYGMEKEDALIAFERHATSKINSANDLFKIQTFGFRGEALPSIGAVSQVVLTTCDQSSLTGTRIKIIGGRTESVEEVAFSTGTAVEVRNLFFNIPARRKFIKNHSYEAGLITELITKYSLGHPHVRFRLLNGREVIFDTAGLNSVLTRLVNIYGDELIKGFLHIEQTEFSPGYYVEAWLAHGKFNRNTRSQQTFFINGRLIKSMELSKCLDQAYHTLIPKGRFPIALINLIIPSHELDINIHPAKLQIKINSIEKILNKLTTLFKDKLWNTNIIKTDQQLVEFNSTQEFKQEQKEIEVKKNAEKNEKHINNYDRDKVNKVINQVDTLQVKESQPAVYVQAEFQLAEEKNITTEKENSEPIFQIPKAIKADKVTVKTIKALEPISQLNNSFILAQNEEGLYIIDQHTCHERILYEKFMHEEENREIFSEDLLIPITLTLSGQQESVLIKNIILLKDLGFIIENFGPRTYLLRSIPVGLKIGDKRQFLLDLLEDLSHYTNFSKSKIKEAILTMAACKGAVKAKQSLTREEMINLLKQLAKVENAHTCPHGRPIFYHLSMQELYKIFQRGEYRVG